MSTKTNTGNATVASLEEELGLMIYNRDWGGICEMIQLYQRRQQQQQEGEAEECHHHHQQQQRRAEDYTDDTGASNDNTRGMNEMKRILLSDDHLPYEIFLRECMIKDSGESAKALLLMLVALGGKDYVMRGNFYLGNCDNGDHIYGTLLRLAIRTDSCVEVVSCLIDANVGGQDFDALLLSDWWLPHKLLIETKDRELGRALFLKLVALGGRDYVMSGNFYLGLVWGDGREEFGTLLHLTIKCDSCTEVILRLIDVGGRDLILEKTEQYGWNSLHWACYKNMSIQVVKKFIEVGGGRDLVWEKTREGSGGSTALVVAAGSASVDVVKELIEVGGGRDIVCEKDRYGDTALHSACQSNESIDVLKLLIEYGGGDIITQVDIQHKTPLQLLITASWDGGEEQKRAKIVEKASFLINKGIELQIGGEYSIGGLFNKITGVVRDEIYRYWDDKVLPTLELVMNQHRNRPLPILQALIVNEAPIRTIKNAVNAFTDSINVADSCNQYPIDIAVSCGLSWDDGLEAIVEAFASAQQTTPFNVCTKHGVQWENGTRIMLENSNVDVLETVDTSTGLYPFMTAAVARRRNGGEQENCCYDLDSIFHLIWSRPMVVKPFSIEIEFSRKRKRC